MRRSRINLTKSLIAALAAFGAVAARSQTLPSELHGTHVSISPPAITDAIIYMEGTYCWYFPDLPPAWFFQPHPISCDQYVANAVITYWDLDVNHALYPLKSVTVPVMTGANLVGWADDHNTQTTWSEDLQSLAVLFDTDVNAPFESIKAAVVLFAGWPHMDARYNYGFYKATVQFNGVYDLGMQNTMIPGQSSIYYQGHVQTVIEWNPN